jgi:hypothetical protein
VVIQGKVAAQVEDGPQGLHISWNRGTLQQVFQELKANAKDPEKNTPLRSAMRGLDTLNLSERLNYAEVLLRELEQLQAQVQEEKSESFNGQAAKVLLLKITPKIRESQRKYMKEFNGFAKIWLAADGTPLGYQSSVAYKGSRFFISFEGKSFEEIRFARSGNRLVAIHHQTENSGSGFGQESNEKGTSTLSLL